MHEFRISSLSAFGLPDLGPGGRVGDEPDVEADVLEETLDVLKVLEVNHAPRQHRHLASISVPPLNNTTNISLCSLSLNSLLQEQWFGNLFEGCHSTERVGYSV